MSVRSTTKSTSLVDVPEELGFLGFWRCDFRAQRVHASPKVNQLFGLCGDLDQAEIPLALYTLRIHPDDRKTLDDDRRRCVGPSGHGVVEYRVIDDIGRERRLMCRGLYKVDSLGDLVTGCGMLIDVTDASNDAAGAALVSQDNRTSVERLSDLLVEAFVLAKEMDDPCLSAQMRATLLLTGRILAKQIQDDVRRMR